MMTRGRTYAFTAVRVLAVIMALLAVGRFPYSFYMIVRCVVSPVAAYTAFVAYQQRRTGWAWTFAALAALFNPLLPARLDKTAWQFVDLATGLLMLSSLFVLRPSTQRRPDDDRP